MSRGLTNNIYNSVGGSLGKGPRNPNLNFKRRIYKLKIGAASE